ncbi:MAG TPA: TlpA disulfide reductase family protein, partial [Acidimicrobiales bacterium]
MAVLRVLVEQDHEIDGLVVDGRFLVAPDVMTEVLGWKLRPEGLCRGDVCVPVAPDRRTELEIDGLVDVGLVAELLGRPSVTSLGEGKVPVVAIALSPVARQAALDDLQAPDFSLPDLEGKDHSLIEWQGKKKLLVTFASWCGCRYDLPGWQALHDELAPAGFSVIGVAMDNAPEDVAPFTEDITFPVLYDSRHLLSELYAISNVPTVVWIDEDDTIVRPNGLAFGSDLFSEFTGVDSGPHMSAVRSWVNEGTLPISADDARGAVEDLSVDEIMARLHFRIGADAFNRGDDEMARRHLT